MISGSSFTIVLIEFEIIRCGVCEDLYYVDETTYNRVKRALEFDPTDNPFSCDDCEEEYDEEAV